MRHASRDERTNVSPTEDCRRVLSESTLLTDQRAMPSRQRASGPQITYGRIK
ncbi:hypothetical protein DPMN_044674 [Dreissena polymorpha]|uniref:Uncharacterized protein n=1 Tax=Dreissena polymorpha TaxID=45954 RepID=A0A9D4HZ61_DREPO|nr:hypothetical protein DPMN_044674 [Dreissena polymorpha]